MTTSLARAALLIGLASKSWAAESPFKVGNRDEILASSRDLAHDLMSLYKGNETGEIAGILPGPPNVLKQGDYYWWEAGGFWNTFIDYWYLTGDETYNQLAVDGISSQAGDSRFGYAFMHPNWTASLGNGDQCVWALAALSAAERGFPAPAEGVPSWADLAQGVFDSQLWRWDREVENGTCGDGGLRWQVPPTNNGYNYKDSLSNGCFFNLGARLGRLNGNKTAIEVAEKAFSWMTEIGLINTETWDVYDGGHVEHNCTDINKAQFSASASVVIQGAAFMYNITGNEEWRKRLDGLVGRTLKFFFPAGVAFEPPCEERESCTVDMTWLKSILHRSLASVTQLAPYTAGTIQPVLETSAKAAVAQCTGGDSGRKCGFYWVDGIYQEPSSSGVGEQMNVLSAVLSLLAPEGKGIAAGPGTGTGGSGGGSNTQNPPPENSKPSGAGRNEIGMMAVLAGLGIWLANM
ncbi:hypothetical protein OQA88_8608 [Cercophora sp. LCS_1]